MMIYSLEGRLDSEGAPAGGEIKDIWCLLKRRYCSVDPSETKQVSWICLESNLLR